MVRTIFYVVLAPVAFVTDTALAWHELVDDGPRRRAIRAALEAAGAIFVDKNGQGPG